MTQISKALFVLDIWGLWCWGAGAWVLWDASVSGNEFMGSRCGGHEGLGVWA